MQPNSKPIQELDLACDGSPERRAEVGLSNLSQFSNSVIENVNVWVDVLDIDLNIVLWNHVAETTSGYMREEVVGHGRIWDWMYPDKDYRRSVMARTSALLERDGDLEYLETQVHCKNNETKFILWNSRSLLDEKGVIYGAITFGYDITDRKQAEEALQKAHSEISALYHVASVASASLDLDTILERSLDCVLETMKSDKGLIHLWDEGDEKLRLTAQRGIVDELLDEINQIPLNKGLTGWVFTHGEPLMTPNIQTDPSTPIAIWTGMNLAYIGVPMRAKGKVVGVFGVLGETGRQFRSDEVALLASIADQVGVAVENAFLYQKAEQLAVLEERERLAHELHDSVTQSLYSLTLLAEASWRLINSGNLEQAGNYVLRLGETAQDTLKELRLLVYKLRPRALDEGLLVAIQQRLGAVERRAGVKACLIADDIKLSAPVEDDLYRITLEALNNSLKHAKASSVTVRIQSVGKYTELEVEDNGIGFDPNAVDCYGGIGLTSMEKRAKRLGGSLKIYSTSDTGGTRVCVRFESGSNHQHESMRRLSP